MWLYEKLKYRFIIEIFVILDNVLFCRTVVCNIQYFLMGDSNYVDVLVYLHMTFLFCVFLKMIFITRSYLSFLIKQLCNTIVYLLPTLSINIRFRVMDAIFGVRNFIFLNS